MREDRPIEEMPHSDIAGFCLAGAVVLRVEGRISDRFLPDMAVPGDTLHNSGRMEASG